MCSATSEGSVGPRLALIGAASLLGTELKQQLADTGLPGAALSLLDAEEVAGALTEYGDEARVLAEAVAEEILDHDVVCFCGTPDAAREHFDLLRNEGRVGLDCSGAWAARDDVFLWLPGVGSPPHLDENPLAALPSTGSMLVGSLMEVLGDCGRNAAVTLLLPASDSGEAGLQELSQQTIAVLNLEDVEHSVFGRQLAFDLWPASEGGVAVTVDTGAELRRLGLPTPAISTLRASVFHGVAASVFLPDGKIDTVRATLCEAGLLSEEAGADIVDSPTRAAGHAGLHVSAVRADPSGGSWLWVVADNLIIRAHAAAAAIHTLLGPELSDALQ